MPVVALVADTHLPRFGRSLPRTLIEALEAARPDAILHLGDHTSSLAVDELSRLAPVEAVAGNNDPDDLVGRFGWARVVEAGGVRIGLTHGHLGTARTTPARALAAFSADHRAGHLAVGDRGIDVVAFGHSHIPWIERRGKVLLVNPGSPTDRRRQPRPTFALLDVSPNQPPIARIVELPVRDRQRIGRSAGSGSR